MDSSRGRGKLNIEDEVSKNVVGSNDRQHHQNQDSPNDYEDKKSAENPPKVKNTKKKSEEVNTTKEEKKKSNGQNNKENRHREERDGETKRNLNHGITISSINMDSKQKRDSSHKQNTNANSNKNSSSLAASSPSPNKIAENEKLDSSSTVNSSTGHPVSPREKSRAHASPKSSPEADRGSECDRSLKRRSKDSSDGSEGGSPGEHGKQKTVSRGSTTTGQSSTVAKVTQNDNDREQKPCK